MLSVKYFIGDDDALRQGHQKANGDFCSYAEMLMQTTVGVGSILPHIFVVGCLQRYPFFPRVL